MVLCKKALIIALIMLFIASATVMTENSNCSTVLHIPYKCKVLEVDNVTVKYVKSARVDGKLTPLRFVEIAEKNGTVVLKTKLFSTVITGVLTGYDGLTYALATKYYFTSYSVTLKGDKVIIYGNVNVLYYLMAITDGAVMGLIQCLFENSKAGSRLLRKRP